MKRSLPSRKALRTAGTSCRCMKLPDASTPLLAGMNSSAAELEVWVDRLSVPYSCLHWGQNQNSFQYQWLFPYLCVSACEPVQAVWIYPGKCSDISNVQIKARRGHLLVWPFHTINHGILLTSCMLDPEHHFWKNHQSWFSNIYRGRLHCNPPGAIPMVHAFDFNFHLLLPHYMCFFSIMK